VLERSHDPRFIQRIRHDDGTTVYQWPVGSPLNEYLRETARAPGRTLPDQVWS
jgi:hypothetical protein